MPFRKKVLYYGIMLLLTLLVLEGMARIAYYAAYGEGYGGGRSETPADFSFAAPGRPADLWQIRHPFYGFIYNLPYHDLSAMPPRLRREDTVVIALLGGSVAEEVAPHFQRALNRRFAANNLPRQPVVLNLAVGSVKQPQQTLLAANTLLLGGEVDLMVNLDGFNEMHFSGGQNFADGIFPFFPVWWRQRVGPSTERLLLAGQIGVLRREQARLMAAAANSPLRRSAAFGLVNRWRQERTAAEIIRRNHQLAALKKSTYNLEKYGPRSWLPEQELLPAAARVWYRGSVTLSRLAELAGAEYYHFLQPNQYVPDSKPLSVEELAVAYAPGSPQKPLVEQGYPLLKGFCRDLPSQSVPCFDLTGIFAARPETLYRDDCCHLNARGYDLLAAAMVQQLEPALRRRAARPAAPPVSDLAAARRPAWPAALLVDAKFRVYRAEDSRWLRYARDNCAAADVEPRFFLHLTPRDLADLPPYRREHGYDNRDFGFAAVGGALWRGQCAAQIRLPDYPIAHLRTGQYTPDAGELWAGEFPFPE